jgi:hypothetical protein
LAAIGAVGQALVGDYGLGWQIGTWVGLIVVVLLAIVGAIAFLDEKFGWGLTEPARETGPTISPEEVLADDAENYGAAQDRQETRQSGETRPGGLERGGDRVSHPDYQPADTAQTSEQEAEAASAPSQNPRMSPESKVYDQIRRLAELRDEGLITPEEFEVKKRELLDRL